MTNSLFHSDWWLSATQISTQEPKRGTKFGASKVYENGRLIAVWPWQLEKRKFGLLHLTQPKLTQFLGPLFYFENQSISDYKSESKKRKCLQELVGQFPRYDVFTQNLSPDILSHYPLNWLGFSQSTRYTYQIKHDIGTDAIWNNMQSVHKTAVRKSIKLGNKFTKVNSFSVLKEMYTLPYKTKDATPPYSSTYLESLYNACLSRDQGAIYLITDKYNLPLSCAFLVWDSEVCYYLVGATNDQGKNNNSMTHLLWECIVESQSYSKTFDFEGSMLKNVESYFRKFGGNPVPYHQITQTKSSKAIALNSLRSIGNLLL